MVKDITAQLNRFADRRRTWLDENGSHSTALAEEYVNKSFDLGGIDAIRTLPGSLSGLAHIYGTKGCLDVFAGNAYGWENIERAVQYHLWTVRLRAEAFFKQAFLGRFRDSLNLTAVMSNIASLLCFAVVNSREDMQRELAAILSKAFTVPDGLSEQFWNTSVFEAFVLRLILRHCEADIPARVGLQKLGVYDEIFFNWNKMDLLRASISKICDYHCQNMVDRNRKDRPPEFEDAPFDFLPSEILAIYTIRNRERIDIPLVEHPLLRSPLASPIPLTVKISDPILDRVETLYCSFFTTT